MTELRFSLRRFMSLVVKEILEILRDRSIIIMGLGLPVLMLLIFGFGVSMDMERIPAAMVLETRGPAAERLVQDFSASKYFEMRVTASRPQAEKWLRDREVELILNVPSDFEADLDKGRAKLQLTLYGVDSNSAVIFQGYVAGIVQRTLAKLADEGRITLSSGEGLPSVTITSRSWFNDAANSRWYLVPGLLVLVGAVSASFMGSIVVAREHERGTLTALFATPASSLEILLAKWVPYTAIAFAGALFCIALAFLLFDEPLNGSFGMLLATTFVFVGWANAMGLFISAKTKSQFLATEAAILATFMPTFMLSGFMFDLRSVPKWIEVIGMMLPPTHAVESFKICFLSGGQTETLLVNAGFIGLWWLALFALALKALRKREPVMKPNGGSPGGK